MSVDHHAKAGAFHLLAMKVGPPDHVPVARSLIALKFRTSSDNNQEPSIMVVFTVKHDSTIANKQAKAETSKRKVCEIQPNIVRFGHQSDVPKSFKGEDAKVTVYCDGALVANDRCVKQLDY